MQVQLGPRRRRQRRPVSIDRAEQRPRRLAPESGSTNSEIGLDRYEYCTATLATSPPSSTSSGSIASGWTQPVPVGTITTSDPRSNAPVRSSSPSASAARASALPAEGSPA